MEMTSYVGAGVYGINNPNELTLNHVPKLMFISYIPVGEFGYGRGCHFAGLFPELGVGMAMEGGNYACWWKLAVEVEDKTVKWYSVGSSANQSAQMNATNSNYIVAAFS